MKNNRWVLGLAALLGVVFGPKVQSIIEALLATLNPN